MLVGTIGPQKNRDFFFFATRVVRWPNVCANLSAFFSPTIQRKSHSGKVIIYYQKGNLLYVE